MSTSSASQPSIVVLVLTFLATFTYLKKKKKIIHTQIGDTNIIDKSKIHKRMETGVFVGALLVPRHLVQSIRAILRSENWLKHSRNNTCNYQGTLTEMQSSAKKNCWMAIHVTPAAVIELNALSASNHVISIKNSLEKNEKQKNESENTITKQLECVKEVLHALKDQENLKSDSKSWIKDNELLILKRRKLLTELIQGGCIFWIPGLRLGSPECLGKKGVYTEHKKSVRKIGYSRAKTENVVLTDINSISNPTSPRFRYVELFAGIGGFRIALDSLGGRCVFASEMHLATSATYHANFGECPIGDITDVNTEDIPHHDLLTAGFPCQSFSQCGEQHGMTDKRGLGNLFWEIMRIANLHRPRALLLENVANLVHVNEGYDFCLIVKALEFAGYQVHYAVINSLVFLPQQRRRLYIIGFQRDPKTHEWPKYHWPKLGAKTGKDIYKDNDNSTIKKTHLTVRDILEPPEDVPKKYELNNKKWEKLNLLHGKRVKFVLARLDGYAKTLMSNYRRGWSMHSEFVPPFGCSKNPRFFTPRECARLQGFPDTFKIDANLDEAAFYHQIGNAVTPPVIRSITECILKALEL